MKRVAIVGLVLVGAVALTGCEDGPECLDYDTQLVTTTTLVNGKPVVGTTVVSVCTEYAEPSEEPSK